MDFRLRAIALAEAHGWIHPMSDSEDAPTPALESLDLSEAQLEELVREALQAQSLENLTACPDSWALGEAPMPSIKSLELPVSARFEGATLIARGGTSQVFRAFDTTLQRFVALKFLRWLGPDSHDLVLREARAQAQIEHPNVCRVYEVGALDGQTYIAMQLVEGATLSRIRLTLSTAEKIRVLRDVAEGAHAAHSRGLVHLDLKPGNILMEPLSEGGFRPLITDFGLYLTERGGAAEVAEQHWIPLGTPPYCSPEQLAEAWPAIDRRSDIYSLGVTLYTLLAGCSPFEDQEDSALRAAILSGKATPLRTRAPELAPDLAAIVHRAMAFRLEDRYDSARDLASDLDRFLKGEPVRARASGFLYAGRKWVLRNRLLSTVLACAVCALAGAALWASWRSHRAWEWAQLSTHYDHLLKDTQYSLMDLARPLHDTRGSRDAAMEVIVGAEKTLAKESAFQKGPLHLTLGRLYLEQGFLEKAQFHLEASLSSGFGAEDIEVYLAMTLLMRYFTELEDCSLLPHPEHALRVEAAAQRFKAPALALLKRSLKSKPTASVSRICEAVLENRMEEAQTILEDWRSKDSTVDTYSALLVLGLNAQVSLDQAREHPQTVLAALRSRLEAAESVVKATPSQAAAYAEIAECHYLMASLFQARSAEGERLYREAVKQAAFGLVSEPDNPQITLMHAQAQRGLCNNLAARGRPAEAARDSAVASAQLTLSLLPRWEGFLGSETTQTMRMQATNTLKGPTP